MADMFGNFQEKFGKLQSDLAEYEHPVEIEVKDVLEEKDSKPSFDFLHILLVIVGLIILIRLLDLQITQGVQFQNLAEGNRLRTRLIEAPRGIIFDRSSNALVKNTAEYRLEIIPADLPRTSENREKIYQSLKDIISIDIEELKNKIEVQGLYSFEPLILKNDLPRDEALTLKIKLNLFPGVLVAAMPTRIYNTTDGLSHILGYIGKVSPDDLKKNSNYEFSDRTGKSGLEYYFNDYIMGKNGQEQVEVDSRGLIQRILASEDPVSGNNLILTLDLGLQQKIAEELKNISSEKGVSNAVAIAVNPSSGGILSMVSLPSYDNNLFSKSIKDDEYKKLIEDQNKPLLNRAIGAQYPSGSTIKPMVAVAALDSGIITQNTTIYDPGEIRIGEWVFPDWKTHGQVDIRKAIAESCDVFFYALGGGWDKIKGLGALKLKEYLNKFGFGEATGIDLEGEQTGLVPDPTWKKKVKNESWYVGDTYHFAIGQGDFLTTPLQLIMSISSIANGGELLRPHLLDKITNNQGENIKTTEKTIVRNDIASSQSIEIAREGMRQTVTAGTARVLSDLTDKNGNLIAAAGKTGTAQFGTENKTHSWFVSFAPYDNPTIALVVLVEGGGEGNDSAVPVSKNILNYWFNR